MSRSAFLVNLKGPEMQCAAGGVVELVMRRVRRIMSLLVASNWSQAADF